MGGGAFLAYNIANSPSACTISLSPSLIKDIKTKTFFSSLGCVSLYDFSKIERTFRDKFEYFLQACFENENILLSLRNDGSLEHIKRYFPSFYASNFHEILDNGFFYKLEKGFSLPIQKEYIALNITKDQLQKNEQDLQKYYENSAKLIEKVIDDFNLAFVFVPHIYSDLEAFCLLLNKIDERYRRFFIFVAPLIQKDEGADFIAKIYANAKISLCCRFHANIINLALNKKIIGIATVQRTRALFESVNLSDDLIDLNMDDFFELLYKK